MLLFNTFDRTVNAQMHKLFTVLIVVSAIFITTSAKANVRDNKNCGIVPGKPLTNSTGPIDYTDKAQHAILPIILDAHFPPHVERLERGNRGYLHGDLDYTLRAIPNYHRALFAMGRFQRERQLSLQDIKKMEIYTADCYFKRAIYHQQRDAVSRMLYAMHLQKTERLEQAKTEYLSALKISPNNPELHYNMGLFFVELGELEKAKEHAIIAYQSGYPLTGLQNKLYKLGVNLLEESTK